MALPKPNFKYENQVKRGFLVVGVDEVGRGAFAGPVVAGAVAILNFKFQILNFKFPVKLLAGLGN